METKVKRFKPYKHGHIRGFFELEYHDLTIKGCRLMAGNKGGYWIAFPQSRHEKDGETEYRDILWLPQYVMAEVKRQVVDDLKQQGHIDGKKILPTLSNKPKQPGLVGYPAFGPVDHFQPALAPMPLPRRSNMPEL